MNPITRGSWSKYTTVRGARRTGTPLALTAGAAAILLPAAAGRAVVKVDRKPAATETKTYDPKDPPKDVHGLGEHESGLTMGDFGCKVGLSVAPGAPRPQGKGKCQEALVVQSVQVTIDLKTTVWVPDDANDKLKAHEEGHRQMAETIYNERAEKAAKAAGALVDGKRFIAEADTCDGIDKAVQKTMDEITKKVYDSYLSQTADASARAGDIYDEVTAHGTNSVDEKVAERQAFAKQAEEAKQVNGATGPSGNIAPGANPPPVRQSVPK